MSTTTTTTATTTVLSAASEVKLSPSHTGHTGVHGNGRLPAATLDKANKLLQLNHENFHIFFRDKNAHNHLAHSILSCLALGATPEELQRAYDDGEPTQRPIPQVNHALVEQLADDEKFYQALGSISEYHSFLVFFQRQIDRHGWKETVHRYCFSGTKLAEAMFVRLYEGALHPIIHLGLGIEFEQPSIVAEGLAQAAAHEYGEIGTLFFKCEELARQNPAPAQPKTLVELLKEVAANETIRGAPKWEEFWDKLRDGIIGRAGDEMAGIASQFQVRPEELERRTAEMISASAYMAGASQRPGKKRKIDFFFMHCVTSSILFSVINKQSWISLAHKVRLVEWKARIDLALYAFNACPDLRIDDVDNYYDDCSRDASWEELFAIVNKEHDDGHVAKFIRALKNGEDAARPFEQAGPADAFPVSGDRWLKIARMSLGTTTNLHQDFKWIFGIGWDQAWGRPDLQ